MPRADSGGSRARVLIAPDKFKNCLTASEVAAHISTGVESLAPGIGIVSMPIADGGDGFLDMAARAGYELQPVRASGPTGKPVDTAYARRGDTAVIELAAICGLRRLPGGRPDPLGSSSYGVGEVMAVALDQSVRQVILGIGGSASTDGGAGMLQALGAEIRDVNGLPLGRGGAALTELASLDISRLHPGLAAARVLVACDVDSPLTGAHGAAAVFGPQKGASAQDIAVLERGLQRWAGLVAASTGRQCSGVPGSGAAGGTGYAAIAVLGAELRAGIDLTLELLDFESALADAMLVITGEGSMDEQTLSGKAPNGVARAAARLGVPVVAVAGQCSLGPAELSTLGIRQTYALTELEPDPQRSMANAGALLERMGRQIAREWLRQDLLGGALPACRFE